MSKLLEKYQEQYKPYVKFIDSYRKASNAASGSEVDSNANVENKNKRNHWNKSHSND